MRVFGRILMGVRLTLVSETYGAYARYRADVRRGGDGEVRMTIRGLGGPITAAGFVSVRLPADMGAATRCTGCLRASPGRGREVDLGSDSGACDGR
jgi:hypothetical protein